MALWNYVKKVYRSLTNPEALPGESGAAQPPPPPKFSLSVDGDLDIGKHGLKKLEVNSGDVLIYVSRHGFQQRGVTCPRCDFLAARPDRVDPLTKTVLLADWERVHKNQWGEYVACGKCGRMLYASPNDDEGDPKPGETTGRMAPEFFCFVRPAGWKAPRQRTTTDKPKIGSWVVIEDYTVPAVLEDEAIDATRPVLKPARCLNQDEGRVVSFNYSPQDASLGPVSAEIALGGNEGMAGARDMGSNIVTVPLENIFVMVLPVLRTGDPVIMKIGPHEGKQGRVVWSERAIVAVRLDADGLEFESPLLHVERLVANERPH